MSTISFFVGGIPKTKGNLTPVKLPSGDIRARERSSEKIRAWRSDVKDTAIKVWGKRELLPCAVKLVGRFQLPRPQSHYGTGKNARVLKPGAPRYHTGSTADLDKLLRMVGDVLTGTILKDDGQICVIVSDKRYGEKPGVLITIEPLDNSIKQRVQEPRTEQPLLNGLTP